MRLFFSTVAAGIALVASIPLAGLAQQAPGPYHVLKIVKVGGDGGSDYVYADVDGRRLDIARTGQSPRMTVFDLDTFAPVGEIPNTSAHGAATDAQSHHAFASSSPVAMWDTKTTALIKTIPVEGRPDGILADAFNHRVYVFSHEAPNATVLDAKDGSILGTIDLGGAPEQAQADGKGRVFVDLEDKDAVAVVDAKTMKVMATYSLNGKGGGPGGLGLDVKNHVLFVACHDPQTMVMLDADTGKYLADLPIGQGCDGGGFNPGTGEAFSSQGDGTLTIVKETSPTTFVVEQTVTTMPGARTMTVDTKTGHVLLIGAEYQAPAAAPPATPVAPGTAPAAAPQAGPGGQGGRGGRGRRMMVPGSFSVVVVGK